MPLYEFRCADCGAEYEELVSLRNDQAPPCPTCSSSRTEKKMSVFGGVGASAGSGCRTSGFS